MDIVLAVLAASAFLVAALLFVTRTAAALTRLRACRGRGSAGIKTCPLCSSVLDRSERVKSKLFPGKGDRIMHIFGCPYCWPRDASPRPRRSISAVRRVCPVCGAEIGRDGWVIARYFERPAARGGAARAHVHILGCTECRT